MVTVMETKTTLLSEAALIDNSDALLKLLQEDPLILDRAIVSCPSSETPLHIAAMLNHLDFVRELLSRKPELASELDSLGCSPLHLASAKGHVEVVKQLLVADPEMGSVRNSDGRTPLHAAVVKGRVDVVAQLARVVPESTRVLTDRGETVLHLCVKYSRVEALRVLLGGSLITKEDVSELVNLKDCEGNTVLHIAVAKKQTEIVKSLLSSDVVEVNVLSTNNYTPLDILTQNIRDWRGMQIEDLLQRAGALSTKDLHLITNDWGPAKVSEVRRQLTSKKSSLKKPAGQHKHTDWLGRKRSALIVVASLIATVAFQATLTPPGGEWEDDYKVDSNGTSVDNPHSAGEAVMAYRSKTEYGIFMIFNTLAFLSSLSIILLLVSGLPIKRRRWTWIQMVITWVAITAQVLTYFLSLRFMSPEGNRVAQSTLRHIIEISVLIWLSLMLLVFVGNMIRVNLWILRKYGYIKEKDTGPSPVNDGDDQDDL